MTLVGEGEHIYEWVEDWAGVPDSDNARTGWAHPGMVVTDAGYIITFHQGQPQVLVFDQPGNLIRSWEMDLVEGHGLTLVKEGGLEYLWFADPGRKRSQQHDYQYPSGGRISGQVVKTDLEGRRIFSLTQPDLPAYQQGNYCPTSVAVGEEHLGGNGDVWVADGYGQSYVHRFDREGRYLFSINGEEGLAGAFNCPHGIWIDRRKSEAELYVADRGNRRIQVYDLEGKFKRDFGSEFLTSPSAFAAAGDLLIVAELRARLALLDLADNLIGYLGDNTSVAEVEGWPNVPSHLVEPGKFNSPHGIATDERGNIYVAEWLIGGRFTKLVKSY